MEYYDLVDTLVKVRPSTGLQDYYAALKAAQKIYSPNGSFKILTSQPAYSSKIVRELTTKLFPNCLDVQTVASTAGKIVWLRALNASSYTDNDPKVRAAIAKELPELQLYAIVNGVRKPA
jgi:hypothetical protein